MLNTLRMLCGVTLFICAFPANSQTSLFFCGDCSPPVDSLQEHFQDIYTEMAKGKGDVLGVGSDRISVSGSGYQSKSDKEALEAIKKGRLKYYRENKGDYQLLRPVTVSPKNPSKEEYSKEVMVENFKGYLKKLDKSKPITLYLGGHGWNRGFSGKSKGTPQTAGFTLREAFSSFDTPEGITINHEELLSIFKEVGLSGTDAPPVRIIASYCYGGGIHYLSEELENVCTASFTSFDEEHFSGDDLGFKFWENYNFLKKHGEAPSLEQTFNSIKGGNRTNKGAALGSTQYVKNILKQKGEEILPTEIDFQWGELKRSFSAPDVSCKKGASIFAGSNFDELSFLFGETEIPSSYRKSLEDLRKNEKVYQEALKHFFSKRRDLQKAFEKMNEEEKAIFYREMDDEWIYMAQWIMGSFKETKKEDSQRVKSKIENISKEFEDLVKKEGPTLIRYLKHKDNVQKMMEEKSFFKLFKDGKVSKSQMKTYKRMVKCESLSL